MALARKSRLDARPGLLAAKSVFAKAELPHGIVRHYNECNVSGPSVADDGQSYDDAAARCRSMV